MSQQLSMLRAQETFVYRGVQILQQRIEEARHIHQANGFFMQPKLQPGECFEQLFKGSETTGQCRTPNINRRMKPKMTLAAAAPVDGGRQNIDGVDATGRAACRIRSEKGRQS